MRILILLILLLGIDYYAFQAVRIGALTFPKTGKQTLIGLYLLSSLFCYVYILGSYFNLLHKDQGTVFLYLRALVFIVFFSKFFIGLFVAIDDIRRIFLWLFSQVNPGTAYDSSRSTFISQMGLIFGALPFISLTYGMWRNPYRYQLHRHQLSIGGLSKNLEGLRIVQISDIHSGTFTNARPLKKAIKIINDLKADLVFFTGDLVNYSADEMQPYLDLFGGIKAEYGVYSVLGNHDYGDYKQWPSIQAKQENFQQLIQTHKTLGWDLLRNEHRVVEIKGEKVAVIGVENSSASPRFHNYGDLAKATRGLEEGQLKILLSHDPSHWDAEVTKSFRDIHLTLSGHTHGFQFGIEIPGWLKWSPSKYVYKQWAGLYQQGAQHLYVNRGFGMLGYPGRVGILPEITCIDILAKDIKTI
ncbi:MAG: metallophosphoesterase [Saprospiraceae bacterium]|nr:metallophosphoesterase [Saprospiraceae bacterium]